MKEKSTKILLIINACFLLLLLLLLIQKEPTYIESQTQPNNFSSSSSFESVQLNDNIIAVIDSDINSRSYGDITVLEYDLEANTFNIVTTFDFFLERNID